MYKYQNTGIEEKYLNIIIKEIQKNPRIEKAKIFGSRSKGNFKATSDIDIAIYGVNLKTFDEDELMYILNEESDLIYFVDIVNYETLENDKLIENIDNSDIVIYIR